MPDKTQKSHRKKILWTAKIILAIGLCVLVLYKSHLQDKLDILDRNDNVQTLWGRLIERTDSGDWLWRDAEGNTQTISDSDVVKKEQLNHFNQPEPSFELGLISLLAKAYRNRYVWLAIVLFPLSSIIGAWRWQRLLRAGRVKLSYAETLKLTFIGNFFSQALPSLVGGDVIKAYYLMRSNPRRKTNAVMSILVDRLVGLAGLAIVCLAAVLVGWNDPLVERLRRPIFIVVAVLAVGAAVLFIPGLARALHLVWLTDKLPFKRFTNSLRRAVRLYSAQPLVWLLAITLSVITHLILLSSVYLGGRALAPGTSYHDFLLLLPPAWMLSAIPITPGAAAWMEMWYQSFFARVGVSATAALSLSLFHRFLMIFWALPGLIIYLKGPGFYSPEAISLSGGPVLSLSKGVTDILATEPDTLPNDAPPDNSGPGDG